MERIKFIRYWPLTLILLASIVLLVVLVVSFTPAQALNGDQDSALQTTPGPTLPPVTVVPPTVIVPETGGNTVVIDFFSSWVLWAVLGAVVIALLIVLAARPVGPTEPHHHHDM